MTESTKVLIVEDNDAIREIIAQVLDIDGCETRKASTLEEAAKEIDSFKPHITILDTRMPGGALNFAQGLDPDCGTKVILILSGKEEIPKDSNIIVGGFHKPFKSSDILDAVRAQREDMKAERTSGTKDRPRFRFFFLGKSKTQEPQEEPDDGGLMFGKNYLVLEDSPSDVYEAVRMMAVHNCDIFVITADRPKSVKDRFESKSFLKTLRGGNSDEGSPEEESVKTTYKVTGLAPREREGYMDVSRLGTLMAEIMNHAKTSVRPVIVIDNLTYIIESNNMNLALTLVYQVMTSLQMRSSVIVSVRESILTEKDKNLLLSRMELYKPDNAEPQNKGKE